MENAAGELKSALEIWKGLCSDFENISKLNIGGFPKVVGLPNNQGGFSYQKWWSFWDVLGVL